MPRTRPQHPVIVIPGIIGTSLHDEYPLQTADVWTMVLSKEYERLALHPDDLRYEAREPARVVPGRAFGLIYDDLVGALRHDLTPRSDQPTPVFVLPFDWRQELQRVGQLLDAFVEEVIARTQLLRHYNGYAKRPKVDLVGHSMGGLVICEYLSRFGTRKRIGKVATLGTPFRGSVEAIVQLLTGMGNLSGSVPTERERESARSTPSVYHLLPSYPRALVPATLGAQELNLFDIATWQPTVIESLSEYVRLHALKAGTKQTNLKLARDMFRTLLALAELHRARVMTLDLAHAGLTQQDWLVIVGIDARTRVRLTHDPRAGSKHWFRLQGDADWLNVPQSGDTGDSTVPLPGALPGFIDESRIVAVSPRDFGLLELRDRLGESAIGFHAMLPNLSLAQRLVLKHLRPTFGGRLGGRPIPGIAAASWNPPVPIA